MRAPISWPTDSHAPGRLKPTSCERFVSRCRSSAPGAMLTAARNARRAEGIFRAAAAFSRAAFGCGLGWRPRAVSARFFAVVAACSLSVS